MMPESSLAPPSSWQYATKCVALLEMVLSVFQIAYSIFAFAHSLQKSREVDSFDYFKDNSTLNTFSDSSRNDTDSEHDFLETPSTFESTWMLIYGVFCFVIAVILYWGAIRRNLKKCKIWMFVSAILFAVEILEVIMVLINHPAITLLVDCIVLSINALCMWIVYLFMQEIRGVSSRPVIVNPKPRV